MARGVAHSDETKAAVMAALLTGQGVSEVAKDFDLDASIVSRWKKAIPPGKLQSLLSQSADAEEQVATPLQPVATKKGVATPSFATGIDTDLHSDAASSVSDPPVSKGEQLDELLFGFLRASLVALRAQAQVAADESYLKRFPPQQLAVLHGVMADKTIRLFEAINRSGAGPAGNHPGAEQPGT